MHMPVSGVPVAVGAGRDVALGVALIPDVHVALEALPALGAVSVEHLDLGCPGDRQELIPCTQYKPTHHADSVIPFSPGMASYP